MPRELRHSSPKPKPILPARGFQGLGGLCRKENSSQSSGGRLLVVSRCHDGYEGPNGSATRFWNMNQIPFQLQFGFSEFRSPNAWLRLPLSFRIDWLVFNGCSHETLLHIGPPGPLWSICYYHQDLHHGRLQPGSHPEPSAPPMRPSYSLGLQGIECQLCPNGWV